MDLQTYILETLEKTLGDYVKQNNSNFLFNCPFCNHHKKKLTVKIEQLTYTPWHCWVCNVKGGSIRTLLEKLKYSDEKIKQLTKFLPEPEVKHSFKTTKPPVKLPEGFTLLSKTTRLVANIYKKYLYSRGLTNTDIQQYNIGYDPYGKYKGRVIIPSYDSFNQLNYFTARCIEEHPLKYYNARGSKNIIFFESRINWNLPVVLCEGPFDAMCIKRNVIPLLGKRLNKKLLQTFFEKQVRKVILYLDKDAVVDTNRIAQTLYKNNIKVHIADSLDRDAGDLNLQRNLNLINNSKPVSFSSIIKGLYTI